MFNTNTTISFISFLSAKFPKFNRGKDLFNLHPVSLTVANRKRFTASDSVRQAGLGVIFAISLFGFAINFANAQNVNVAGAISGNGSYATLSAAFNAVNGGFQGGANISITITGNTTEPAGGAILSGGAWNSLFIQPSGMRVISGTINPGLPLIDLNGADNVTIDGLNSGTNSLTMTNATVSSSLGTSTISFRNDASNNKITRSTILGSSTDMSSSANVFFYTATVSGNDNNVISYCDIGPAGSNLPASAVTSTGSNSPSLFNTGDTIRNCNVFDYFNASASSSGIYLSAGSSDFVIKDNKFYQTSLRNIAAPNHSAVWIDNTSGNNFKITGNIIGYSSSNGTGSYSLSGIPGTKFNPICLSVGTTAATAVNANTIAGISMSGFTNGVNADAPFIGILISAGTANIGSDSGNVIGDLTTTGNINFNTNTTLAAEVVGIDAEPSTGCTINNNLIGSIISSNASTGQLNIFGIKHLSPVNSVCQNNIVGGTIANSIQTLSNSIPNTIIGINRQGGGSIVTGNIVRNMTAGALTGILISSANINNTISQNTVYALSSINPSNSLFVRGLYVITSGSANIEKNLIHSLSAMSPFQTINGIQIQSGTSTIKNNMIRIGLDTSGNSMTTSCTINGMIETGGTNNFYFNSVYIGGTVTSGNAKSFAFQSLVTNNTRNFLNNIFYNARTNNSASVKHYAVSVGGTGVNPAGLNCNYNILYAPNIGGTIGFYNNVDYSNLVSWRAATGQDNNSQASDPMFINPTGSASSFDLHINNTPTPVEQKGISIGSVTDDFDGETRSLLTPTDIGADAGNFTIQTDPPLEGDYAVGLSLFNSVAGTNIHFKKTMMKVMREVEEEGHVSVIKEVQEERFIPYDNDEIYNGPLFVKRIDDPNLQLDAMSGVYATLTAAVADLNLRGSSAPVRFLLTDNDYTSETLPLVLTAWPGASANNTLTIKPNTGVTSIISGTNSTAVFDINTGDYFILDGSNTNNGSSKDLTVANSSTFGSTIRFINDARNNTVRNCILKGSSTSGTNGVVFFSTTTGPSGNDSNLVQNNDITKNSGFPIICVYNNGTGATSATKNSNNRITGNRIFDFQLRGFYDEGNSAGTLYESNEIFTVSVSNGFQVGFRVVGGNIEGFTFRSNYIHDLKTSATTLVYGIELSQIQNSFTGEVYNNFISLSEVNSNDIRGIVDGSPAGNSYNIYYNSVNISGTVTGAKNSDAYHRINASNTNFKNNILVNTRTGGTGKHYTIRTVSPLTNFNCNYNDIYAGGGTGNVFGRLDATDRINLADWQTATGIDSSSVSGNPLFVSTMNLHIDSTGTSPVNNAGTPIAGITTDIDNNIRSLTTPDIGADEFRFTAPSITMNLKMFIEGFYSSASNLQVSDTVKIYLRNSGSPYALIDSAEAVVSDSGKALLTFSYAATGTYYIVLTHRNSIGTWSAVGVAMTQGITSDYDFTNAASKAFDYNMKQVDNSPARFAIYSGDINQDGVIDLADITDVYNSSVAFVTGYVVTDVDGNNTVDLSDITLTYNNSVNFVSVRRPIQLQISNVKL